MKKKISRRDYLAGLTLATELSPVSDHLSDYAIWIYGAPKIGKTSLTTVFPEVHHFMFEDAVKAYAIKKRQIEAWDEFRVLLKLVRKSKFKNITLDVVEEAHAMCFAFVCKEIGIDHPSDIKDYGKSWKAIEHEFMKWMNEALSIPGVGCVFISHASSSSRKTFDGDEVTDYHPAMSGKILDVFSGRMDLIGYYHLRKGERVLQIRQDDNVIAGCRIKGRFLYTDGSQVKYVPMGNSEEEAYENLQRAFDNELERPVEKPKPKLKVKRRPKIYVQ